MDHRIQRFVIPATVVLITIIIILLISGVPFPKNIIGINSSDYINFIITIGITSFGFGYICHVFFVFYMFINNNERLIDENKLLNSFGLKKNVIDNNTISKKEKKKNYKKSFCEVLSEFHIRLHSHAPKELLEYLSRRNSAWFIAKTSGIAIIIGIIVASIIIIKHYIKIGNICLCQIILIIIPILLFIVFIYIIWQTGNSWNKEYWDVAWKWISRNNINYHINNKWIKSLEGIKKNNYNIF